MMPIPVVGTGLETALRVSTSAHPRRETPQYPNWIDTSPSLAIRHEDALRARLAPGIVAKVRQEPAKAKQSLI